MTVHGPVVAEIPGVAITLKSGTRGQEFKALEGKDDVFALSYIENALTSNRTLAPLSTRDMDDVYTLIRMAQEGQEMCR